MRSKERAEAGVDALETLHRKPAQVDGKDLDQDIADHEHRHREADHRQSHHEAVDPGAVLPCRDDAERHRDGDGKDDGRQRDADRGFDALADHLQHRHIRDQGNAEIAMQQLADPGEELGIERFVQPERGANALELLRRRVVAGQNRGGIARGQPQQQKHEQRHHAHHGYGGKDAAKQISEHRFPSQMRQPSIAAVADLFPASVSVEQIPCHGDRRQSLRPSFRDAPAWREPGIHIPIVQYGFRARAARRPA